MSFGKHSNIHVRWLYHNSGVCLWRMFGLEQKPGVGFLKDENCSVVLLCHSSLIEVFVHEGNIHSRKDDLPRDKRDSFEVHCAREVFRQLVFLLECLREEFCWLKRMKYKVGVICPVCCHKRLVSYCSTHHKQDCEREECLHFISESELRNANQSITCTRSAVAVNNKVYIKDFTAWFVSPSGEVTVVIIDTYTLLCFTWKISFSFCRTLDFWEWPWML